MLMNNKEANPSIRYIETVVYQPKIIGVCPPGRISPSLQFNYTGNSNALPATIGIILIYSGEGVDVPFSFEFRIKLLFEIDGIITKDDIHELHLAAAESMANYCTSYLDWLKVPIPTRENTEKGIEKTKIFDRLILGSSLN
jgi:hypothetical protein